MGQTEREKTGQEIRSSVIAAGTDTKVFIESITEAMGIFVTHSIRNFLDAHGSDSEHGTGLIHSVFMQTAEHAVAV